MRRFAPVRTVNEGRNRRNLAFEWYACAMRISMRIQNGSKVTASVARPEGGPYFAIACVIVLISFSSALATELRCSDLETADADKLLAMVVDRQWIKNGGGVRVGDYDCYVPGQKVCEWRTTLEDDRMLDRDYRLIYVLSSHQTGSGSWGDLLVFGCVSGKVKTVYQGQFGQETSSGLDSAPPALRPVLKEYMKHPGELPPP
jgi:hypothetical protein